MTIILGVNLEEFVLILADTRVTSCNLKGEIGSFSDNYEKIFKTKFGLVAGGGSATLLKILKNQLISSTLGSLKANFKILNLAYDTYLSNPPIHPQETTDFKKQSISETSLFFSEFNQHTGEIRLIYAPCSARLSDKKYTILPPGFPWVDMQCSDDIKENIRRYFENEIKLEKSADFKKCIQRMAYLFGRFIKGKRILFPNIGEFFQIGIHLSNGRIEVSEIIKDDFKLENFLSKIA